VCWSSADEDKNEEQIQSLSTAEEGNGNRLTKMLEQTLDTISIRRIDLSNLSKAESLARNAGDIEKPFVSSFLIHPVVTSGFVT
jgi:hypothetical protein